MSSSTSSPAPSSRHRTRNAQAQADLRARRKQYIKTLEDTVTSLEACVRQLRTQNADLLERTSVSSSSSSSSSSSRGDSIDKLRAENAKLHQILADVGLAAAAASKMAKVGKDSLPSSSSASANATVPSPSLPVISDTPHREREPTAQGWTETSSITNKKRKLSKTQAFAQKMGIELNGSSSTKTTANVSAVAAPTTTFEFDTDLSFLTQSPAESCTSSYASSTTAHTFQSPIEDRSNSISTSATSTSSASSYDSPETPTDINPRFGAPSLPEPFPFPPLSKSSAPPATPQSSGGTSALFAPEHSLTMPSPPPSNQLMPPPQFTQAFASYAWNCWLNQLQQQQQQEKRSSSSNPSSSLMHDWQPQHLP